MNREIVDLYIEKLPYNEVFTGLPLALREKIIFSAEQMLSRRYAPLFVTDEAVALQALYIAEGEEEEFAKFKRQGVTSISLSGLSISAKGSEISPEVVALVERLQAEAEPDPVESESDVYFGRLM